MIKKLVEGGNEGFSEMSGFEGTTKFLGENEVVKRIQTDSALLLVVHCQFATRYN